MKMIRRDFLKLTAAALAEAEAAGGLAMADVSSEPRAGAGEDPGGSQALTGWIWAPKLNGLEPNTFVYFRREFDLDAMPSGETPIRISASTEYKLYVNGSYIGFGPPISSPRRLYFDTHNLSPCLRKGRNVIAVQVYSLATATEDTVKERGYFFFQGSASPGRRRITLDSDNRWKCLPSQAWLADAPRQSPQLHYVEIADFQKEPAGWNGLEFDDSKWPRAVAASPKSAGARMVPREMGEINERFSAVAAVVRLAEVERKSGFTVPAVEVQAEEFLPVETVKFSNIASVISPLSARAPAAAVTTPAGGRDAAIVFDMGRMVLGCPCFEVEGAAGATIDVSISEYLKDGRVLASRYIGVPDWGPYHTNLTDRITVRQGTTRWKRNDYNGYRYIQLTIRDAQQPLTLRRVGTVLREYGFRREAVFRSSNSALDRIFDGSKWSHRVNTHWGYCGSAWREHAQWCDLAWHRMNLAVFHDAPILRYYLEQMALGQKPNGRIVMPPPGQQDQEVAEQTMWLADCLWRCALYFDDRDLVRDLVPVMVKANGWFQKHITPSGLISTKGWPKIWLLIDWGYPYGYPYATSVEPGELATLNLIYYRFLSSVQQCAGYLGDKEIEADFRRQSETVKEAINKTFWLPQPGFYVEKPDSQFPSAFANTLAVKYGVVPKERLQAVFDSGVGIELRPGEASPWFMYSALEAFAEAGRYEDAVTAICRYWGTFLDAGASVYWELWNIPGQSIYPLKGTIQENVARTITYSSGPAAYAVNHILGVQPLAPGFRQTLIAPHPSGLDSFEGKAPTPRGYVHVAWRSHKAEGNTELYIGIPEGIGALLQLPWSDSQPNVTANGQPLFSGGKFSSYPRIANPTASPHSLDFKIAPGYYYFRMSGSSRPAEIAVAQSHT